MFFRWGEMLIYAEKFEKGKYNAREKPELFNYQKVVEEQIEFDKFKNLFFNNLQLEVHEFEAKYTGFYDGMIKKFVNIVNEVKLEVLN